MIGVTGFEPATPASRRQCSTKLSYTPSFRVAYERSIRNRSDLRAQRAIPSEIPFNDESGCGAQAIEVFAGRQSFKTRDRPFRFRLG